MNEPYVVLKEIKKDYITCMCYSLDEDGKLREISHEPDWLEYYRGKLDEEDKVLWYVSTYLTNRRRLSPALAEHYEKIGVSV